MTFQFSVPTPSGSVAFQFEAGETVIFVGANGGGKTRLTVHIEESLGTKSHRISAHRALNLDPGVAKISEQKALAALRVGHADEASLSRANYRPGHRWQNKQATFLLNDFNYLIQALFADQSNTSLLAYHQNKPGAEPTNSQFKITKFDKLNDIWKRLLPHRVLHISGDDILVSLPESDETYKASEMSDGERAIFYMIGQALVAAEDSVLIVDEPELHVHRSIMSKLWDEIEAARPDCGFVFITHDLEFAAVRAAQKFVIKDYSPAPSWDIEAVPENTGFNEELTTLILGSRKPVLFVEGTQESLDLAIYRACYPDWTVVPRSSCTEVIHSVVTMRKNAELTRVTCSGVVDGDDYEEDDRQYLQELGIAVLPVAEIENLLLLQDVSAAIAGAEGFSGGELDQKLSQLANAIFGSLDTEKKVEAVVVRYCRRRIDRALKKVDLSNASTIEALQGEYAARTGALDIEGIAAMRTGEIHQAISERDLPKLLRLYDNKQLLALAATHLKGCRKDRFEGWVARCLRNNTNPELTTALRACLPQIEAS
ncbi:ABC transporter, ATP-binding protein-related protein [Ruegeria lacuscaerulensis ITI-1157]|nr:ABC transporter, ATP-binding protein-related protein [Ruegeria lacuscaerulensis ITI-1157]SHK16607.1 ABC-type lipoprotein export system, ATPase component [Ruegeria lacuscaerulensis ITI-1157]